MPEKDPATAAAEAAAKELVKLAYGDLLQPSFRTIGTELDEVVRAVIVAGRGFGALIHETYKPFVLRAIARVPADRRIPPAPELLGPILEGVTYHSVGSDVADMFEALLASSMDAKTASKTLPAFPNVIRQLSPDEVKILRFMETARINCFELAATAGWDVYKIDRVDTASLPIDIEENATIYMEHLLTLGLIDFDVTAMAMNRGSSGEERMAPARLSRIGRLLIEVTRRQP